MHDTPNAPQVNAADTPIAPGAGPLHEALSPGQDGPWWTHMNRYHWFVFVVAALGWLFDCLDQQLFVLARPQAMRELVTTAADGSTDPKALDAARSDAG